MSMHTKSGSSPAFSAHGGMVFLLAGLILIPVAFQSCSYPSTTAGGGETSQAILDLGVSQFNHLHGWQAGDHRRIDDSSEINFGLWTAFWKLDDQQRKSIFNTLPWDMVVALCTFAESNRTMNEAGNVLPVELQRLRYRTMLSLLDSRYDLKIGTTVDLPGMKFLMRVKSGGADFSSIEILQYFVPRGQVQDRKLNRKQTGRLHLVFEGQVQLVDVEDVGLVQAEQQLIDQMWP